MNRLDKPCVSHGSLPYWVWILNINLANGICIYFSIPFFLFSKFNVTQSECFVKSFAFSIDHFNFMQTKLKHNDNWHSTIKINYLIANHLHSFDLPHQDMFKLVWSKIKESATTTENGPNHRNSKSRDLRSLLARPNRQGYTPLTLAAHLARIEVRPPFWISVVIHVQASFFIVHVS